MLQDSGFLIYRFEARSLHGIAGRWTLPVTVAALLAVQAANLPRPDVSVSCL